MTRRRYTVPRGPGGWPARGRIDPGLAGPRAFRHPAVREWHRWLLEEWGPRGRVALVTPCSNVKPYPRSPASGKIRGVLRRLGLWDPAGPGYRGAPRGLDWLYLSDLLALVPYERAHEYPACCYDVPPEVVERDPGLREALLSVLAPAVGRLLSGVDAVIVYLPSRHLALWREAVERAGGPGGARIVEVGYDLFHGHERLREALAGYAAVTAPRRPTLDEWLGG